MEVILFPAKSSDTLDRFVSLARGCSNKFAPKNEIEFDIKLSEIL